MKKNSVKRNKYVRDIIDAKDKNKLVFFIGAGVSKSSETDNIKIPVWGELIESLKKELVGAEKETDYLKIAQLYYLKFKKAKYTEKIKKLISTKVKPSIVHEQIFKLNPMYIITTNWDTLLEDTVSENIWKYDVIACDKELVESKQSHKIIKMHGDLTKDNIVFKEDDYLEYQDNFPLIENFIKSIVSTNTILFLGYSYNDINLKYIVKWLNKNSKNQPAMYLLTYNTSYTQSRYLKNFGITTICFNEKNTLFPELIDEKSKKLATFLYALGNDPFMHKLELLGPFEQLNSLYKKLSILSTLRSILLVQVSSVFSNCGYHYAPNGAFLHFYDSILTTDYDEQTREYNASFKKIFIDYIEGFESFNVSEKTVLDEMVSTFNKAQIRGIVKSDNIKSNNNRISYVEFQFNYEDDIFSLFFPEISNNYDDITNLFIESYVNYLSSNFEKSYESLRKAVELCVKDQDYARCYIAIFNQNIVLRELKMGWKGDTRKKYQNIREIDLWEFSGSLINPNIFLKLVSAFISHEYLYNLTAEAHNELHKLQNNTNRIVFNSLYTKNYTQIHENALRFFAENFIILDNYLSFQNMNKVFIELAIFKQKDSDTISLTESEIFACIKYIQTKELRQIFNVLTMDDSKKIISVEPFVKEKLIDNVFVPLSDRIIHYDSSEPYEQYFENLLFLLAFIDISENIDVIEKYLIKVIQYKGIRFPVYEAIEYFIRVQVISFNKPENLVLVVKVIETLTQSYIQKERNGHLESFFQGGYLSDLFIILKQNKITISNKRLISNLIGTLENSEENTKLGMLRSIVFPLAEVTNTTIKEIVVKFLLSVDTSNFDDGNRIVYELLLAYKGYKKLFTNTINELRHYLDAAPKDGFRPLVYSEASFILGHLSEDQMIDVPLNEIQSIKDLIDEKITNYNERIKSRKFI